jgi:hypothetical protein
MRWRRGIRYAAGDDSGVWNGAARAFLRFFACEEDWSHESMDAELPARWRTGKEPLLMIGAIACAQHGRTLTGASPVT